MGWVHRTATVAGAARSSRGRFPLSQRIRATGPMLAAVFTGRWKGASAGRMLLSLVGIGYVISPLDLMPEVLLGPFGLGDDLAIAIAAVASLLSAADAWLADRGGPGPGTAPSGSSGEPADGDVIQGEVINRR